MKFVTFLSEGQRRVGIADFGEGFVWALDPDLGTPSGDMLALIRNHDAVRDRLRPQGAPRRLSEVRLEAPIPRPFRNVLLVGKNYHEHAHEFTRSGFDAGAKPEEAVPEVPIFFTKPPETVVGPGDAVRYPTGISDHLDYEVELAIIIGKGGRGIRREDAYGHVWGYTIINDVTARDVQGRHKQWFLGKSFDTFCPMGPCIVTADEVDAANLGVRCFVNGELRQNANTRDLIFDIPCLIETASRGMTLYPGDIIATGTPAGVGIGFNPPRFLKPGDRVRCEIDGIGALENPIAE